MKLAFGALLAGLVLAMGLIGFTGFAPVLDAARTVGWTGLAALSLFHLLPTALCAVAWHAVCLDPAAGPLAFFWCRRIRDTVGEFLGFIPAGGEIAAIATMRRLGIGTQPAIASTVVDLTVEALSQAAFTLLVVVILVPIEANGPMLAWSLAALVGTGAIAVALAALHRGEVPKLLESALTALAGRTPDWLASVGEVRRLVLATYADRRRFALGFGWHVAAWAIGTGEAWLAFHLIGSPLPLATVIVLESLCFAVRAAAFFVPGAIGIQEGGYLLIGAALGVPAETALAVALLKRGREIMLGIPTLVLWQMTEGRAVWRQLVSKTPGT